MTAPRTRRPRRALSPLALIALAGTALAAQSAHAAILTWANPASGTAGTAANWSPAQVPLAADDLVFNAGAGAQSFAVTFAGTTLTSRTMVFNEDTITLTMSSPHTTTNGITIASIAADVSTVTLTTGTWTSSFNSAVGFDIGDVAGATGTLNVNDDDADLILSGPSSRMRVGVGGTGTLNITNVGRVEIGNGVIVGSNGGSSGTLLVSGGLAAPPFGRSTLVTTNAAGLSHFGSSGACTATISSGALADIASDLFIGQATGSVATTTVGGVGGLFRATLDVAGDVYVGANDTANVAGTGTLTVNTGGDVFVGGTLHVGDDANGGSGTLNINAGALVEATSVVDGSLGGINHAGGTLRINGGTYSGFPTPLTVSGPVLDDATLVFTSNSVQTLTPLGGLSCVLGTDVSGGSDEGILVVEDGADVDLGTGDLNLSHQTNTRGTVTVTGAGSRLIGNTTSSDIRVGLHDVSSLTVQDFAEVLCSHVMAPGASGGNGNVVVSSGGLLTTRLLTLGTNGGTGPGAMLINPGASVTVTDAGLATNIRTSGRLTVTSDAVFNSPGTITLHAANSALEVAGAVAGAGLVEIVGGSMTAELNPSDVPVVGTRVNVRNGGTVEVIGDDLIFGVATTPNAVNFDSGSLLRVGAGRTATILTGPGAGGGTIMNGAIDLQGGTIVSDRQVSMAGSATDQIGGFGAIDADLLGNNAGTCTPTGSGIVFLRRLGMNAAFDAVGTAVRMAPGSILRSNNGPHVFNCKFTADAGSDFAPATGNTADLRLILGDGTTTGVTLNGVIHMGTGGSVTINDSNGCALGSLTDMNGGNFTSNNGLTLGTGRILRGRGFLNVPSGVLTLNGGTIDPDAYDSVTDLYQGVATFTVSGTYSQHATATYLCEVAGYNNEFQPQNDRINVSGLAVLNGTLDVSVIDGYEPKARDRFTILTGSTVVGTFSNLNLPPHFAVQYFPTRVDLVVLCDGDVNCDFALDGFDVETMEKAVGGDLTDFCQSDPDFNGDFALDGFDVEAVEIVVGGGECP